MERKLLPIKLDSYKPLREVVSEALREAIIAGVLQPGERLMEIQLAEELGVSRTPVREAIRKLELEGFVVMVPRRGTYVADLSIKDINEVFEIRTSLDVLAAGLAAERITEEELEQMERLLVEIGEYIENEDIEKIVEVDTRFRAVSIAYPGRLKNTQEEHRKLLEAIAQRNVEAAQQIAREHMENAEQITLYSLSSERERSSKSGY